MVEIDYEWDRLDKALSSHGRAMAVKIFRVHGIYKGVDPSLRTPVAEPNSTLGSEERGSAELRNLAECYEILDQAEKNKSAS